MSWAVFHEGNEFLRITCRFPGFFINLLDEFFHKIDILPFIPASDIVGFAGFCFMENLENRFGVVYDIQPIAGIFSVAVYGKWFFVQNIMNTKRNQFFRKMIWSVIIGAIGNDERHSVRISVSSHQMIGS